MCCESKIIKYLHDKAKASWISIIIDTHDNIIDFPSKGKQFSYAILSRKKGEISNVDSGGDIKSRKVLLRAIIVFAIEVSILRF